MGCAWLRSGGRHWPDRCARRVAAGQRRQQVHLAGQPGPVLPAARFQHLRPGRDSDAVHLSDRQTQPDPNPDTIPIGVGQPLGDRDRVGHSLPIAVRCRDAIGVPERYPESVALALG